MLIKINKSGLQMSIHRWTKLKMIYDLYCRISRWKSRKYKLYFYYFYQKYLSSKMICFYLWADYLCVLSESVFFLWFWLIFAWIFFDFGWYFGYPNPFQDPGERNETDPNVSGSETLVITVFDVMVHLCILYLWVRTEIDISRFLPVSEMLKGGGAKTPA